MHGTLPAHESMWDPNIWFTAEPHEHRIYTDDTLQHWAVVDEEDHWWASLHKWHINKPHAGRNGAKLYVCRNLGRGGRYGGKLYLHVEIMKRTGQPPPCPHHTIVDHKDGNELNCRRSNLRWATPRMNRMNIKGMVQFDLV